MEKYFRPDKLEADPNSQTAAKEFKHWYETFKNFLESNKSTEKSLEDKDKYMLLINFVSHSVYDYISEAKTYISAIKILEELYIKPTNEIYARHILATRKQQINESIDQYAQQLKLLAKNCEIVTVERGIKTLINASTERADGFLEFLKEQKSVTIHVECRKSYTRKCSIAAAIKRQNEKHEASTSTKSRPLTRARVSEPAFCFKQQCLMLILWPGM
uniref:Uncharacterized protein LOC114336882 n=1 Tax=Diabrotica virgifera virgifera TaxID=50390 RepID=A0A6P7GGN7_DIAVI